MDEFSFLYSSFCISRYLQPVVLSPLISERPGGSFWSFQEAWGVFVVLLAVICARTHQFSSTKLVLPLILHEMSQLKVLHAPSPMASAMGQSPCCQKQQHVPSASSYSLFLGSPTCQSMEKKRSPGRGAELGMSLRQAESDVGALWQLGKGCREDVLFPQGCNGKTPQACGLFISTCISQPTGQTHLCWPDILNPKLSILQKDVDTIIHLCVLILFNECHSVITEYHRTGKTFTCLWGCFLNKNYSVFFIENIFLFVNLFPFKKKPHIRKLGFEIKDFIYPEKLWMSLEVLALPG